MRKKTNYFDYLFRDPLTGFPRHHTPRKIFNLLLNQIAKLFGLTYVLGMPIHMNIEVNNTCDLRCPMCSSGQKYSRRKRGLMSYENFTKIVDEVSPYLYKIGPFNLGEPLLHKDIFKMIRYAQAKNVAVIVSTNGNAMDAVKAEQLVDAGLEELIISMDAATEHTYQQNRPGGNFEQLLKNIRTLMGIRAKKKSRFPFVIINMILMDNNIVEMDEFVKLAKTLGVDKYNFSTYWEMYLGDSVKEKHTGKLKPKSEEYKNIMPSVMRVDNRCSWAWSGCIISWDGTVIPCCFDYNETYRLGNVFEGGIRKIWNNERYRGLRHLIRQGRLNPPLCRNCPRVF
ncbi:MAG: radical SAM protein [Candidatus Margulisbacteria bacterium]|nr:radical SAM protein [Candidatus Margulisiibacteriota bacterium]